MKDEILLVIDVNIYLINLILSEKEKIYHGTFDILNDMWLD